MGTRCLTVIKDNDEKQTEIVVMYRQMDGYPSGHGKELKDFLKGKKIVNGFGSNDEKNFNGMACLAAQVVAHFKTGIGGIYLHPAGTRNMDEEFIYTVYDMNGKPKVKVEEV